MFVLVINRDISFQVWESKECLIQIQKIILLVAASNHFCYINIKYT